MRTLLLHPSEAAGRLLAPLLPDVTVRTRHPGGAWDVLVRWGASDGSDAPFTFNASWALANVADREASRNLLELNGVARWVERSSRRRSARRAAATFRIHTVDLRTVAIRRLIRGMEQPAPALSQRSQQILEAVARRALYALGLHFGAVDVVVESSGKPLVRKVNPAPSLDEELLTLYGRALAGAIHTLELDATTPPRARAASLLMGADPEFVVVRRHNRAVRCASDLFPMHGSVGYDRQITLVQGRRCHPIAEVRPVPAPSPYTLVEHVRRELQKAYRMAPDRNTDWLAGAHPAPGCFTGGHVHFSGVRPTTFLLRSLDNYLAIPSLLMENRTLARARRPRYGLLGAFRLKEHGGFEYRTLSSWLTGVRRARSTLCLAKLVAVEYPRLRRHLLTEPVTHRAFYEGRKGAFRDSVEALWDDMRVTDSYKEYSQDLEGTRIWILNRRQWREQVDLKRLWSIV